MYQTLSALLYNYAALVDQGRLDNVAELLKHCTIFDPSGNAMASGQQEICAMYKGIVRIYEDSGTPRTQHVVSNFVVESESSKQAKTSAYFQVLQRLSTGHIETIMCGRYENVFEFVEGQWVFSEHHMFPVEIGDMSEHLLIPVI